MVTSSVKGNSAGILREIIWILLRNRCQCICECRTRWEFFFPYIQSCCLEMWQSLLVISNQHGNEEPIVNYGPNTKLEWARDLGYIFLAYWPNSETICFWNSCKINMKCFYSLNHHSESSLLLSTRSILNQYFQIKNIFFYS